MCNNNIPSLHLHLYLYLAHKPIMFYYLSISFYEKRHSLNINWSENIPSCAQTTTIYFKVEESSKKMKIIVKVINIVL